VVRQAQGYKILPLCVEFESPKGRRSMAAKKKAKSKAKKK
jgi:hypothetical protein